jgi:uncharacterized spore protein YtfJ
MSIPIPDPSQPIKPILSVFTGCAAGAAGCAEVAVVAGCAAGVAGCAEVAVVAGCDLEQAVIKGIDIIIKTRHITKMMDFLILLLLLKSSVC